MTARIVASAAWPVAIAVLYAFVATHPAAAEAQEQEQDDESPVAEDVIVVVGERLEESLPLELEEYGARVEQVSHETVETGGYIDVSQVLTTQVPGLYVSPKNGPFDYVNASLQGSRGKDILWLVDGVRISNRLYDTTSPLDTLPANVIERVEVLKGGQSLFYGTQSVGGVVNVVTLSHRAKPEGQLSAGLDSNDGTHLAGSWRGGKGIHRFVVHASNDRADGFQPFRDHDYQPSATDRERGYDVTTFGARYRVALTEDLLFSGQAQHTDGELDFAAAEDRARSFNERDEEVILAKLDWSPTQAFDLFAKAYWHDWDSTFTRVDNDLANPGNLIVRSDADIWQFTDYGLNILAELDLQDEVTWLFGYDHQSYEGRDDVFIIGQQTESVDAVFTQIRFDFDSFQGARLAVGGRHNEPSDGEAKTVWNVSGAVDFNESLYGRGQVGTSFRLPSAYELYVIDPCCEKGNPNLVGEESWNAEMGLGGRAQRFYWEATVFDRQIDDLISIDYSLPAFPDGLIVNTADEVEMFGWEVSGGFDLRPDISGTFGYTRVEAEARGTSEQIPDIPLSTARLGLDWRPDALPFRLSATIHHVGEIYDAVGGGVGRVEHGGYAVADLAGQLRLGRDGRHRIGVRIENLFDTEYDTRVVRVRRDSDGSSYGAGTLGVPLTGYVTYGLSF